MNDEEPRSRPGPVGGNTPEAQALARWISELTAGLSLRALAERFGKSHSQWGEYRRGGKIIPLELLTKVIQDRAPSPLRQRQYIATGTALIKAAEEAAALRRARDAATPQYVPEPELRLLQNLDDARRDRRQVEKTLEGLNDLIQDFAAIVAELSLYDTSPEEGRPRRPAGLPGVDANKARELQVGVQERLERARAEREEAEELHRIVQRVADQYRWDYEHLTGVAPPAGAPDDEEPIDSETSSAVVLRPRGYDEVLRLADTRLDGHSVELDEIRDGLPSQAWHDTEDPRGEPDVPKLAPPSGGEGDVLHWVIIRNGRDTSDGDEEEVDEAVIVPAPGSANEPESGGTSALSGGTDGSPSAPDTPPAGAEPSEGKIRKPAFLAILVSLVLAAGGLFFWLPEGRNPEGGNSSPVLTDVANGNPLIVGTKENQPGLSVKLPSGDWGGVDVDLANLVRSKLKSKEKVTFNALASQNREGAITSGEVHIFVGSYSITKGRMEDGVAFAGPYIITPQSMLMRQGVIDKNKKQLSNGEEKDVVAVSNLPEKTKVCVVAKSTAVTQVENMYTPDGRRQFEANKDAAEYDQCIRKLESGEVDVMVADRLILEGFMQGNSVYLGDRQVPLVIVENNIPDAYENYGIGMKRGDGELGERMCEIIDSANKELKASLDKNKFLRKSYILPSKECQVHSLPSTSTSKSATVSNTLSAAASRMASRDGEAALEPRSATFLRGVRSMPRGLRPIAESRLVRRRRPSGRIR